MSFRFKIGDHVWIRDRAHITRGGYRIVPAVVVREPYERNGNEYFPVSETTDKGLWWASYPACRVFATREEAVEARVSIE